MLHVKTFDDIFDAGNSSYLGRNQIWPRWEVLKSWINQTKQRLDQPNQTKPNQLARQSNAQRLVAMQKTPDRLKETK